MCLVCLVPYSLPSCNRIKLRDSTSDQCREGFKNFDTCTSDVLGNLTVSYDELDRIEP